jgi:hypothetical protein
VKAGVYPVWGIRTHSRDWQETRSAELGWHCETARTFDIARSAHEGLRYRENGKVTFQWNSPTVGLASGLASNNGDYCQ